MSIEVRPAVLRSQGKILLDVLRTHLPRAADPGRFDWLYLKDVDGEARSWILWDDRNAIGAASAFPRRFATPEGVKTGWVLGDFCVHPRYRSLGPAVVLQRALLEALQTEGSHFWYDFPGENMVAVYRRLGIPLLYSFVRMVRPLRVTETMARAASPRLAGSVPRALLNLALAIRDLARLPLRAEVAPWRARFDERFDDIQTLGDTIQVLRSSEYLNWRYLEHPARKFEVATVGFRRKLSGFAVFLCNGETLQIVDLYGAETASIQALVNYLLVLGRRRKLAKVVFSVLADSTWLRRLGRCGFIPRERHPVALRMGSSGVAGADSRVSWFLTDGDRES